MRCLINFETIIGKKVIGTGGYIFGEVKGATVNTKTWRVVKLHVKLTDTACRRARFQEEIQKLHGQYADIDD